MDNKKGQNNSLMKRHQGPEKRAAHRVKREVVVRHRIKEFPEIKGFEVVHRPQGDISRTRDLSEKGVAFTTSRALLPQTILEIKLQLPTQPQGLGNLEGRVVGCEEAKKNLIYRINVEFINMEGEQKQALRDFVQLFFK